VRFVARGTLRMWVLPRFVGLATMMTQVPVRSRKVNRRSLRAQS